MKYLILMTSIAGEWDKLSPDEQRAIVEKHARFSRALESENRLVASWRLDDQARTVRQDSAGTISESDVPFSGSGESVGGLYVIEADSLDEAVEWGRRGRFMVGANEVRPLFEQPQVTA